MLGDLPIVVDLMPTQETASRQSLALASEQEIERQALIRYASAVARPGRHAGAVVDLPDDLDLEHGRQRRAIFPWPIFVILGTGGYLSRLVFGKESAIEEERERLRKQARSADRPSGSDESVPRTTPSDPEQHRRRDHWR